MGIILYWGSTISAFLGGLIIRIIVSYTVPDFGKLPCESSSRICLGSTLRPMGPEHGPLVSNPHITVLYHIKPMGP